MKKWSPITKAFIILLVLMVICGLVGVINDAREKEPVKVEAKDLVIDIPEKKTYGMITIRNEEGEVEYNYAGYFDIDNDGSDGHSVSIEMTIPKGGYIDGSERLPDYVRVYDRTKEEISDYECSPEIKDGVLHLYDATKVFKKDVKNLIE